MKKLKLRLELDDLQVESFDTGTEGRATAGTVKGHGNTLTTDNAEFTQDVNCNSVVVCRTADTCPGQMTCGGPSCDAGCTDWDCPSSPERYTCLAYECNT